mgnify:CR=1 FL=1
MNKPVDEKENHVQIGTAMQNLGIKKTATEIVGALVFWLFMLTFLISAADALGKIGPDAAQAIADLTRAAQGLDLVGVWAGGEVVDALASSQTTSLLIKLGTTAV